MVYLKFLQRRFYISHLPHELEMLLAVVDEYNQLAKTKHLECIRCTDLIQIKALGSPATVHKNYRCLVTEGFLETYTLLNDRRTRYINITDKGLNYIKKMDELWEMCKNK